MVCHIGILPVGDNIRMCGFVGFVTQPGQHSVIEEIVAKMAATLVSRGPDDGGVWVDHENGIALGHRRLSVVDLSSAGKQPMMSQSDRYVIVFNGEIYNHLVLRADLDKRNGATWRGHSDTETLLAAIECYGFSGTLDRLVGMFAFALWDRQENALYLTRDRLGEKPLYYGWHEGYFLFGSELKALRVHPSWKGRVNRNVLSDYLRIGYISAPQSIYEGIYKLSPGTYLRLPFGDRHFVADQSIPIPNEYWSLKDTVRNCIKKPFSGDETQAINALDNVLGSAIQQQIISDVPLGAFLSGGIDSSLITSLMAERSSSPVKTYTIGFHEQDFNEATYAKNVASHLGCDHTELYVTPEEAMAVIPQLPHIYDEPFADVSQIPTFLVSQLARQGVTVALSGDGGDELFGGYERHYRATAAWNRVKKLSKGQRVLVSKLIHMVPQSMWDKLNSGSAGILPTSYQASKLGYKLHKLARVIDSDTVIELYSNLISHWNEADDAVIIPDSQLSEYSRKSLISDLHGSGEIALMMYLDATGYLPDDILVKVDRASMAVSLESRVPFLDHRVVEFAWGLPLSFKVRDNQGKWIVRQLLNRYVPERLTERPKMGFSVPIDSWLRGPLREWAEALLDENRLKSEGYFKHKIIRQKWSEHLSGKENWQYQLWNVLMFQAWLERQKG